MCTYIHTYTGQSGCLKVHHTLFYHSTSSGQKTRYQYILKIRHCPVCLQGERGIHCVYVCVCMYLYVYVDILPQRSISRRDGSIHVVREISTYLGYQERPCLPANNHYR